MVSVISFIIVIAICVISHEGGHFIAAKWRNVYVHEFSFGMGPSLLSKQRGETKYSVRAFPIGGFVKLEGEDADPESASSDIPKERALYAKKPWERLIILAGGIAVNLLLAWLLFSGYLFANGTFDTKTATVGEIMPNTPAVQLALQKNDVINSINGIEITEWADISKTLSKVQQDEVAISYIRNGKTIQEKINIPFNKAQGNRLLGIRPAKIKYSLIESMGQAFQFSLNMSCAIVKSISGVLFGKNREDISGPVGIAVMSGEAAKQGFWSFIAFLGIINLNLGLVNLLPFPALDGGRIVFTVVEMITGKKVSARFEASVHYVGFIILLLLIVYVTGLDIIKILK